MEADSDNGKWFSLTMIFQFSAKPVEPENYQENVDEAQVRDNGNDVYNQLLVLLQVLQIDTLESQFCKMKYIMVLLTY